MRPEKEKMMCLSLTKVYSAYPHVQGEGRLFYFLKDVGRGMNGP